LALKLIKITGAEARRCAAPLFANVQDVAVWSALEGCMGHLWTLGGDAPRAALCESGDFLFLGGAADEPETRALLEAWRSERAGRFIILAPCQPACGDLIADVFGKTARHAQRYAFHKGGERFEHLETFVQAAPADVELRFFDRGLYALALASGWSRDFCSLFDSAEDFLARGIGVAALKNGELVGGASSYLRSQRCIEIQVETRADMRRQGIAAACCAKLITACLERGLYPSWDAANRESARLAKRLGYRESHTYDVWELYAQKENAL